MDWNAFWTGVGAAAAIIVAIIALVKFFRGRARVVVRVERQDFYLPPILREFLTYAGSTECKGVLARHIDSGSGPTQEDPQLYRALDTLRDLGTNTPLLDFSQNFTTNITWQLNVTNHGQEQAQKLELQIPFAFQSLLLYSDQREEIINGGTIRVPELRPGESVFVQGWCNQSGFRPRLLQASGKATMRFQEPIDDSWWARIYRLLGGASFFSAFLLINLVMVIIVLIFSRTK